MLRAAGVEAAEAVVVLRQRPRALIRLLLPGHPVADAVDAAGAELQQQIRAAATKKMR